jgi:glucose-1-phosphate cytidylyltransferase
MQAVILAGGKGTRISEESHLKPKPMVEIGGRPVLWHIMKIYSYYGISDFIICLGYKGYVIKEFFSNYFLHTSDVEIDLKNHSTKFFNSRSEPWNIQLIDTGEETLTGGRLKRVAPYIKGDSFFMTYGDGLSNVNIHELYTFHKTQGTLATVTATQPPGRFGVLDWEGDKISRFEEKPSGEGGWINGGFFVLSPRIIDYIDGDYSVWEKESMERLVQDRQLAAFKHTGFWRPLDTLRDKTLLEEMWNSGHAPWKVWS